MNVLGLHLLLELKDCNPALLNDLDYIRESLHLTARKVGAHVVGESFHHFSPQGVTGILAIAESHISIHTWPEYGYAAIDVFTCGDTVDPWEAHAFLKRALQAHNDAVVEVGRPGVEMD